MTHDTQELVERLRNAADHAAYEPHLHHVAADALTAQADEIRALRERNAQMEAALTPFAEYMHTDEGRMDRDNLGKDLPDNLGVGWIYLTHGDFRRARAALAGKGEA